jgi:hypothetical protein
MTPNVFGVPLSFDPAASVLAIVAVLIAIQVYRATTFHRVRVMGITASYSQDVQGVHQCFSSVIKNTGLPIHEPKVSLALMILDGEGRTVTTEFMLGENKAWGTFEHGVQGEFELKVDLPLDDHSRSTADTFVKLMSQTWRQTKPCIRVYSGGFRIISIPLVSQFHPLLSLWNRVGWWVNLKLAKRGTHRDGTSWIGLRNFIPELVR